MENKSLAKNILIIEMSGQLRDTPEQHVVATTLRRYSSGLRTAIAQADARPARPDMPASFR